MNLSINLSPNDVIVYDPLQTIRENIPQQYIQGLLNLTIIIYILNLLLMFFHNKIYKLFEPYMEKEYFYSLWYAVTVVLSFILIVYLYIISKNI